MIKEAISQLMNKEDITADTALTVMDEIMGGEATQAQVASFLTVLHMKGETVEEITACAKGMRKFATKVENDLNVLEIVGTGGDRSNSFNISTLSAIVAAAAGIPVAKHGNRAASSKCGTADCLEALGVKVSVEPERNAQILKDVNLCFMFAQRYHTAMKYVGSVRREIGIPTVFNILGPLTNPADNKYQLCGVYSEELLVPVADVLYNLGVERAMVVYGRDCLDEISLSAPTAVCEMEGGRTRTYEITPKQFGFERCDKAALAGGEPQENARIAKSILEGEQGHRRNAVILNAGAAIHIARGVSMEEGIKIAADMIDSGRALAKLNQFIEETNKE